MNYDKEYYYLNNPQHYINLEMHKLGINFYGFFRYMKDIVNTAISQFTYKGIEQLNGLTSTILEEALMFKANLCFVDAIGVGWVLCSYEPMTEYSIYHRPTRVRCMTFNDRPLGEYNYDDIILVKDNSMDIPPILVIREYIEKIVDIEQKMDKMLTLATLPVAIVGNRKLANQFKEQAKKMGCNNPFIVGDESIVGNVQAFNIEVPIKPAEVYAIRKKYINECMASIGVYAVEAKKERLVVSEIEAQNDYTDFVYQGKINERHRFLEELYKRSGTRIELVESYDQNQEAVTEEMASRAAEIILQQGEAIKQVDPSATFGQQNPVKVTGGVKRNG